MIVKRRCSLTGVVDENVERRRLVQEVLGGLLDGLEGVQVRLDGLELAAALDGAGDLGDDGLGLGEVPGGDVDVGGGETEGAGRHEAQAGGAAGDEDDLLLQVDDKHARLS